MSTLRNSIQASVVAGATLIAASAGAQSAAVQWKASEGGNGHWYAVSRKIAGGGLDDCQARSVSMGAHLATMSNVAEHQFILDVAYLQQGLWSAFGCFRKAGTLQWMWVTGEPLSYTAWAPGEPNGAISDYAFCQLWGSNGIPNLTWDDNTTPSGIGSVIVEWDADCNHDGIVDYGQCHDGTLPDYNGDNIPDCCERREACVVGNYPVQWRIGDGENGHWYQLVFADGNFGWLTAKRNAESMGGHLATIGSERENEVVAAIGSHPSAWRGVGDFYGPWLGGFQDPSSSNYHEPDGGWRWVTGEAWEFTSWCQGLPNNAGAQDYLHLYSPTFGQGGALWDDVEENFIFPPVGGPIVVSSIVEWSADCNHDNIVDYGQILLGQLADTNINGIPDICEGPTCRDVDLFRDGAVNGADLGILLIQWGVANANTVSDINHDGRVDGSDLAALLAFWGPCPQ